MEDWLEALVGRDAVLTVFRKTGRRFEIRAKIVGLENGLVNVRGATGMIACIPIDDEYMKIEGARIEFPERSAP